MVPLGLAIAGLTSAGARAMEPAREEIHFFDALSQVGQTPQVQSTAAALSVKRAQDQQISRLTNNPQLGLQLGYRRELEVSGLEAQLTVQQGMSLGSYSQSRRRAAGAEEVQMQSELSSVRLVRELRAGRAWLRLWGTMQQLHAAEHEVELAQKLSERTARAVQVGAMTMADRSEAESYQAEAELALLTLEGEAFEQGMELSRSLGRSDGVPLRPAGVLPEIALPELTENWHRELIAVADQLPSVREQVNGVVAERARDEELRAHRSGALYLGAQLAKEPSVPYSIVGTLSVQAPFFDRGQRERAELLALVERRQGAASEALLEARAAMALALHEVGHTEQIVRKLTDVAVPAMERTLKLRERLLSSGEGTVLEALLSRRAVFALRGRLGRAQADHVNSRFVLSRLLRELSPQLTKTASSSSEPREQTKLLGSKEGGSK